MNPYFNGEKYYDHTAGKAIVNMEKERITNVINEIKEIINENGFELMNRIVLKDKKTGKTYK